MRPVVAIWRRCVLSWSSRFLSAEPSDFSKDRLEHQEQPGPNESVDCARFSIISVRSGLPVQIIGFQISALIQNSMDRIG
jgi:hypothetical protein